MYAHCLDDLRVWWARLLSHSRQQQEAADWANSARAVGTHETQPKNLAAPIATQAKESAEEQEARLEAYAREVEERAKARAAAEAAAGVAAQQ